MVIFDALSPSTEHYDRCVKFQLYRTIESLKEYILVSQDAVRVEQYVRQDATTWTLHDRQGLKAELTMNSIGASLPMERIYEAST